MENDSTKDRFSRRGFLGIGSAALATVAGSLAVSSALAQEGQQAAKAGLTEVQPIPVLQIRQWTHRTLIPHGHPARIPRA